MRVDAGRENPTGIGVQLRLGNGPVREIRAGSAYWSVDDPITVLAAPAAAAAELEVRWPGGGTRRVSVVSGQRELLVTR